MRQTRYIFIGITLIALGILIFTHFNTNGRIIPYRISKSNIHPYKRDHQIIDFKKFTLTLPFGWKDKGFIVGEEGEIRGELKKNSQVFIYEYGITATPQTETLHYFLYRARNNNMIMGDEIIVSETDSTREVTYVYPIPQETSDTIKTGLLTDSIWKLYPKINFHNLLLDNPNYYSLTKYNDSIYFIPIEVPDEISHSQISNFDYSGYSYNLVVPKNRETGFTKIAVHKNGFFPFTLWGEKLDSADQNILIDAGMSLRFNEDYRIDYR